MAYVLIATDDSKLADILCAEIAGLGEDPICEADGYSAQVAALAHAPRVVLLDATLPVFNGLELAALLRADPDMPRELPIYLLTDDAVEPHALERAGVTGIFPKTHDAHQVREVLVDALRAIPD